MLRAYIVKAGEQEFAVTKEMVEVKRYMDKIHGKVTGLDIVNYMLILS